MRSKQVVIVLIGLVVIGLAGLVVRVMSTEEEELVLSGLLPITHDVITSVVVRSDDSGVKLVRYDDVWTIGNQPGYVPKVNQFWNAISELDGAQLVATNPANHARMGVAEGQGIEVALYLNDFVQEQFIVGKWSADVGLCYLRRPGKEDVHVIECPVNASSIFDPDPNGWRNPVIFRVPRDAVESVTFTYPEDEFAVKLTQGDWVVVTGGVEKPADPGEVLNLLFALENLPNADGFADEEKVRSLFSLDTPSIRVTTTAESGFPTTRLRFLRRDEESYYVWNPAQPTVYILNDDVVEFVLKAKTDFLPEE